MNSDDIWYSEAKAIEVGQLANWRNTVVFAPHQDDESLGCGGIIALLRSLHANVYVVFVSDGSMSHPNSKKYPKSELIALREQESKKALAILGVDKRYITFLRLPDSELPHEEDGKAFVDAVEIMTRIFQKIKPDSVLLPWRRDPHKDHRATWQIVTKAVQHYGHSLKILEYFIWLWERAGHDDLPLPGEGVVWKLDIAKVLTRKQNAVAAHVSQTTLLIDDDPEGFVLSPSVLGHFDKTSELFIEVTP